ncbi:DETOXIFICATION 14-like protein [Tanacetum coccineum]
MGSVGAAVAFSLSNWAYLILIIFYVKMSPLCENIRVTISKDALVGMKEFFRFAIPSAIMVCTRVSNELGAGNPQAARLAVLLAMFLAIIETMIVSTTVFSCHQFLGKAYSSEKAVVSYVASMAPFISLSIITDSLQAVISGVARGSGWQHIGAYVNLLAFYLFGVPAAAVLGFPLHLKAKGLWIGIVIGSIIQLTSLSLITGLTDWRKQAMKAKEHISKETLLANKDADVNK